MACRWVDVCMWLAMLPALGAGSAVPINRPLTFFVASDTHLDVCTGQKDFDNNARMVGLMNGLPGAHYPPWVGGGVVHPPQGVIVSGDLVDDGYVKDLGVQQWPNYTHFFGINKEGVLRYPTFEGFGNHDGGNATDPDLNVIRQAVAARNRQRKATGQVAGVSPEGYHSSWDWTAGPHRVHFVNLNLYPGRDGVDSWGGRPEHSLEFMVADLKRTVGGSGAPVVVVSHYGPNCVGRWTPAEMSEFHKCVAPYNVVAFIHGHTHRTWFYRWKGIDVFNAPATQPNPDGVTPGFLVFEVDGQNGLLRVAEHTDTSWGSQWLVKNVTLVGARPRPVVPDTAMFPPGWRAEERGKGY